MAAEIRDLESVYARLEILERSNRRLKRVGILAVLGIGAILATAQTEVLGPVKGSSFSLIDTSGKTRAALLMKDHGPELSMTDGSGTQRISLQLIGGSPFLTLGEVSATRKANVVLFVSDPAVSEGQPEIDLSSNAGLMSLGFPSYLSAGLSVPGLSVLGKDGQLQAQLAGGDSPSLTVHDSDGYQAVVGKADLVTKTTGMKETTSAATVTLFDKAGNVVWSTPH